MSVTDFPVRRIASRGPLLPLAWPEGPCTDGHGLRQVQPSTHHQAAAPEAMPAPDAKALDETGPDDCLCHAWVLKHGEERKQLVHVFPGGATF
eukprot:CAMPEP_0179159750 /NCGR_PEP_ID=MMETSP0796-20121207/78046_1 /TAXON_ID=73915 /ORGANISM="Pyrodinium bahamense, Strain pbaha01" /LENGTH=92 /DNA_ID=CAMNT_0020861581 /DNA_START=105 /DNA_END=382 /DNA_ORIENTATION=-